MIIGDKMLSMAERAKKIRNSINPRKRPVKAKCMNCGLITKITDKDQPCPCCMLCGSLAWQDVEGLK